MRSDNIQTNIGYVVILYRKNIIPYGYHIEKVIYVWILSRKNSLRMTIVYKQQFTQGYHIKKNNYVCISYRKK